jgi:hypothetical protein
MKKMLMMKTLMRILMKMKMLMKIMLLLTDCGFSGSQGAQMNGYSHLPENDKVLEERHSTQIQGMCSLGGEFRLQEKLLCQISMGSPT